jgi:hypothetical protein
MIQQIRDARAAGKAAGRAPKRNVAAVIAEPVEDETGQQDNEQQGAVSNGTGFGSGAYSNKRRAVARRQESWLPEGQRKPRLMCGVQSGRRKISSASNQRRIDYQTTTPNKIAQSEIDNHADTTCFGSNFTAISFTGEYCEVSPFSETYATLTDIPIASAATAWDNPETGEVVILLFHQGLWFGDTLTNSLINPNQCRMYGMEICDDPFDPHRELAITDPVTDTHIPMDFGHSFV